jgi:hypothetical protein
MPKIFKNEKFNLMLKSKTDCILQTEGKNVLSVQSVEVNERDRINNLLRCNHVVLQSLDKKIRNNEQI